MMSGSLQENNSADEPQSAPASIDRRAWAGVQQGTGTNLRTGRSRGNKPVPYTGEDSSTTTTGAPTSDSSSREEGDTPNIKEHSPNASTPAAMMQLSTALQQLGTVTKEEQVGHVALVAQLAQQVQVSLRKLEESLQKQVPPPPGLEPTSPTDSPGTTESSRPRSPGPSQKPGKVITASSEPKMRRSIKMNQNPTKPDMTSQGTLRSHLAQLQHEDSDRILIARRINKLGFRSREVLQQYFSQFPNCEVCRVLVAHSKAKPFSDSRSRVRTRPGGLGLILMRNAESVKQILALGPQQRIAGHEIYVQRFEKPNLEDMSFGTCGIWSRSTTCQSWNTQGREGGLETSDSSTGQEP